MKVRSLIVVVLIILSSCTTQRKCFEKFPNKEIKSDTTYIIKDTTIFKDVALSAPQQSWESWWVENKDLKNDTVVIFKTDTINNYIYIESKSGKLKVKCLADSLKVVLKDFAIELQIKESTINKVEMLYNDQKAENQKLKILHKAEIQKYKSEKLKALGKVVMWFALILLLIMAFILISKFRK